MDILSSILAGLEQESIVFCHAELTASWAFAKDRLDGAPFHAITAGRAWVCLHDEAVPRELNVGDFIVMPHGDAHILSGDLHTPPVSFTAMLRARDETLWQPGRQYGGPVRLEQGGGALTTLISGIFAFTDRRRNPLVAALPRVIHIRGDEGRADPRLSSTLRYLADEATSGQPGAAAVTAKLADILFIQMIRAHLSLHAADTHGWLRGMTDAQIGRSLALMHAEPSKSWTVDLLAESVGVSRAGFAARFKILVGQSPIEYLTNWRMHEAAGLLLTGTRGLADIAESVGYQSEVAFAKAFRRCTGQSPSTYRAAQRSR